LAIEQLLPSPTPSISSGALNPFYPNLRIHAGDGIKLLRSLPDQALTTILITFPDPFPKNHESQWRVVQKETLDEMHRVLKPYGRFYLATDHPKYAEWCQQVMTLQQRQLSPPQQSEPYHDDSCSKKFWIPIDALDRATWLPVISSYEQKGWQEGRRTLLLGWQITSESLDEG
jgi:tRNA G46 methylase TrmB